ncbi:U3 small nucleolar RNA-associated protein 6-domain-containing protein [Elsinoe ampelina]|uniref:U3 small nucleolar RNA-associated protein 6-domain-containing protein n=1 Tax=Elsinoe ampelina TaxID=302913 RepID=A0A6A6G0G1_9PEZI|nr:U3 small nucleolar RNA-associated protein 6-domain-containing protein [Elsinoe ampelina]
MAAAASDKARFFLEQSVPELQAFKEKGIFTPSEIAAIASKRSSFEHRINMAGVPKPTDFARYASYEMNLDLLRKKRCKRMGVRGTNFAGHKRVFGVLERGLQKFPGDLGLWMQYLEFCRDERANSKLAKGITKVLRLHPTKWELWVWAARYYFDVQGDMALARSYMQRGLRFCEKEKEMWVQYLRLEMVYIAKVNARRKILGLDEEKKDLEEEIDKDGFLEADEIALPSITAADLDAGRNKTSLAIDDATIKSLAKSPALSGAIPMAIAEAAAKTFNGSAAILEDLFDCVAAFNDVPCTPKILQQILEGMSTQSRQAQSDAIRTACEARFEVAGVDIESPEFIRAFQRARAKLNAIPRDSSESRITAESRMLLVTIPRLNGKDDVVEEPSADPGTSPSVQNGDRPIWPNHGSDLRELRDVCSSIGDPRVNSDQ